MMLGGSGTGGSVTASAATVVASIVSCTAAAAPASATACVAGVVVTDGAVPVTATLLVGSGRGTGSAGRGGMTGCILFNAASLLPGGYSSTMGCGGAGTSTGILVSPTSCVRVLKCKAVLVWSQETRRLRMSATKLIGTNSTPRCVTALAFMAYSAPFTIALLLSACTTTS